VFTAWCALGPYIKQTSFIFKGLIFDQTQQNLQHLLCVHVKYEVLIFRNFPATETEIELRRHIAVQVKCPLLTDSCVCCVLQVVDAMWLALKDLHVTL
jgi:hypothetical protein